MECVFGSSQDRTWIVSNLYGERSKRIVRNSYSVRLKRIVRVGCMAARNVNILREKEIKLTSIVFEGHIPPLQNSHARKSVYVSE